MKKLLLWILLLMMTNIPCTMAEEVDRCDLKDIFEFLQVHDDEVNDAEEYLVFSIETAITMKKLLEAFPTKRTDYYYWPNNDFPASQYAVYDLKDGRRLILIEESFYGNTISTMLLFNALCESDQFCAQIKEGLKLSQVQDIDSNLVHNIFLSTGTVSEHIMSDGRYYRICYEYDDKGVATVKDFYEIKREDCTSIFKYIKTEDILLN